MRSFRLKRLVDEINRRDLAGVLLFDPLNIRYATATTNMQLWAIHNMFRACAVMADGYLVVWDYKANDLLTHFYPLINETRGGASMFYFATGDKSEEAAAHFATDLDSLLREHSGGNRPLAVDKLMIDGLRALEAQEIDISVGEELMEKTRAVKGPDEIKAMRCAVHACEQAMHVMQR